MKYIRIQLCILIVPLESFQRETKKDRFKWKAAHNIVIRTLSYSESIVR